MSDFNLKKNPLKIVIVGPQKVGKTVIANSLSEFSHTVSPDYHPTVGVRILELEKPYTDEQVANIPVLKKNKINKVKIELWDTCFNYYTIDKNTKKVYLLVDKLKQLHLDGNFSCSIWNTYEFWSTWLKDDFKSKENDIYNYLDENNNNSSQKSEYFFISRITRILYGLGISKSLIDEIVFQNLALKYLNHNQIDDLRSDIIAPK